MYKIALQVPFAWPMCLNFTFLSWPGLAKQFLMKHLQTWSAFLTGAEAEGGPGERDAGDRPDPACQRAQHITGGGSPRDPHRRRLPRASLAGLLPKNAGPQAASGSLQVRYLFSTGCPCHTQGLHQALPKAQADRFFKAVPAILIAGASLALFWQVCSPKMPDLKRQAVPCR